MSDKFHDGPLSPEIAARFGASDVWKPGAGPSDAATLATLTKHPFANCGPGPAQQRAIPASDAAQRAASDAVELAQLRDVVTKIRRACEAYEGRADALVAAVLDAMGRT